MIKYFHSISTSEIYRLFSTDNNGLTSDYVLKNRNKYGLNQLVEKKKKSVIMIFFQQFKDIMILILLVAAAISVSVGGIKDAVFIVIIVLLNAIIGFVQEYKAGKAIEALKKMSANYATVRREGKIMQIFSTDLVPGDVVLLEAGEIVPADIRLTLSKSLKIEEASLTGESIPVEKHTQVIPTEILPVGDKTNMAFKSTTITHGRGEGIVVAIGMNTEIGKIAQLLQDQESQTPLQKRLNEFGKKLTLFIVLICIILFFIGLIRGEDMILMILTSISVAVAAIPEALPAVVTIALAIGAKRMLLKSALIRKLPAVETLGSVSYICTDKTGTITQNKMTVIDVWSSPNSQSIHGLTDDKLLLLCMELNHNVVIDENNQLKGEPTEIALVEYTRKQEDNLTILENNKSMYELPFDSIRKRMTTIHCIDDKWFVVTKGAVESVLGICLNAPYQKINQVTSEFAEQGKRVISYSIKELQELPKEISVESIENNLHFIGLVAMIDPPREEAKQAISDCYSAGITPIMITGDHPITAKSIAKETGIIRNDSDLIITGKELYEINSEEFARIIERIKVYARVSPEQKLLIVKTFQQKNHFVAMTGDGVNDAPALQRANIGIAMGITGTDVSKEASDMVLLDDNFATIIKAVKEGRRIYDNIRKFVKYVMTGNIGKILTVFLVPIINLPIPLLPIHILWINMLTDGLPGLAMTNETAEDDILHRPPRKSDESIFAGGMSFHIVWVGILIAILTIGTQVWATNIHNENWQTMTFSVLVFSQMAHALAIRSDYKSFFQQNFFGNNQLNFAVILTITLQVAVIYLPFFQNIFGTHSLSLLELTICFGVSSIVLWCVELEKLIKRSSKRMHKVIL